MKIYELVSNILNEVLTYLILALSVKIWFSNSVSQSLEYKDNDNEVIENQIEKIIYDMFVVANRLQPADMLKHREEERKWEEQERQRRLEKMRKGELEEIKLLE